MWTEISGFSLDCQSRKLWSKYNNLVSSVKQADSDLSPDLQKARRIWVQEYNCTNTQQGLNLSLFRSGSSQTNPHQSDSVITLCQEQPPQHNTPAPDQQPRSELCREPHLNFLWALHLPSLTLTEKPKTWFQNARVTHGIDPGGGRRGRIYRNSRKGRCTEVHKRVDFGEHDLLCLQDERISCAISCLSLKIFLQPSKHTSRKHTIMHIFSFYFCIYLFVCIGFTPALPHVCSWSFAAPSETRAFFFWACFFCWQCINPFNGISLKKQILQHVVKQKKNPCWAQNRIFPHSYTFYISRFSGALKEAPLLGSWQY